MKQEIKGYSPEKERQFLERLPIEIRRVNLDQELKTQLAEDFGLLEFTLKYEFGQGGDITDFKSREKVLKIVGRGEINEETKAFKKIEDGLKINPEKTWVHFSPKNKTEKFEYPENCVDFWRVINGEVVWNRMVVKNNFETMNKTRSFLSGENEVKDEMELLGSPIEVNLKLAEIQILFELNDSKNFKSLDYIEKVVDKYLVEFEDDFGEELVRNDELIFRLYSACFNALKYGDSEKEVIIERGELDNYMYGIMNELVTEKSFGCSATTMVGSFGEKIGYYVSSDGQVHHGEIPDDYKECKQCGCWYKGEKCPFC